MYVFFAPSTDMGGGGVVLMMPNQEAVNDIHYTWTITN